MLRPRPRAAPVRPPARCRTCTAKPKDAARGAGDAAASYAKDAYQNSGDTFRDGTEAVAKKVQDNPLGALLIAGGNRFCAGDADDATAAPAGAALAILRRNDWLFPGVQLHIRE